VDRILVIDDEIGPRMSLRMLLKNEFEVHCAESVAEGLERFRAARPDAVILDIRMPVVSGIEGLREIRRLDPDVAVIMLTGFATVETAQEALRLGATDYLRKPFDAEELVKTVRANVDRARLNRRRSRALADLQAMNRQLATELSERERMAKMGLASAAFAHDLRNPLSCVLGYFSLLSEQLRAFGDAPRDAEGAPESFGAYLDLIERNLSRCRELTEVWHGIGREDPSALLPTRVGPLLEALVEDLRGDEAAVDRELRIAPGPAEAEVRADSAQLRRALANVLRNALQAVAPKTGRVEAGWRVAGGECAIEIRDNGRGIPEEALEKVRTPFFTTKAVEGGTGLGLYIAGEVARKHGGRLDLRSRPGEGTTVTIVLPAAGPAPAPGGAA